jgi:hypothetical protein
MGNVTLALLLFDSTSRVERTRELAPMEEEEMGVILQLASYHSLSVVILSPSSSEYN